MLKTIWKHRKQILEGTLNSIFTKDTVEQVANWRTEICETNICGYYDSEGISPKVVLKGSPACSICGCSIHLLTRSMSSKCSLHEIDLSPLWDQELSEDEENNLNNGPVQPA